MRGVTDKHIRLAQQNAALREGFMFRRDTIQRFAIDWTSHGSMATPPESAIDLRNLPKRQRYPDS